MTIPGLIIVDMQYDFLPGGALGVNSGFDIVPNILRLARVVEDETDGLVVFTQDWHPTDHISFSDNPQYVDGSWPSHCVQDTFGARIYDSLSSAFPNAPTVRKGYEKDREVYSGFAEPSGVLQRTLVDAGVDQVYVVGLAADYCVHSTALDAFSLSFDTTIVTDATAPVSWATGAAAMFDLGRYSPEMRVLTTNKAIDWIIG